MLIYFFVCLFVLCLFIYLCIFAYLCSACFLIIVHVPWLPLLKSCLHSCLLYSYPEEGLRRDRNVSIEFESLTSGELEKI